MNAEDFKTILKHDCVNLTKPELQAMSDEQKRTCAAHIAKIDISKSVEELMINVHEELLGVGTPEENLLHANKRIAAINAISAIQARKSANAALFVACIALAVSVIGTLIR